MSVNYGLLSTSYYKLRAAGHWLPAPFYQQ